MCTIQQNGKEKYPLLGRKTRGIRLLVSELNIYGGLSCSQSGASAVNKVELFMVLPELFEKNRSFKHETEINFICSNFLHTWIQI